MQVVTYEELTIKCESRPSPVTFSEYSLPSGRVLSESNYVFGLAFQLLHLQQSRLRQGGWAAQAMPWLQEMGTSPGPQGVGTLLGTQGLANHRTSGVGRLLGTQGLIT